MGRTACTDPQCLCSTTIPLLPPMDRTACTEPQCLYSTAIPLLPPMYRTACTEPQCLCSTAIPLLPLCAVRPVQSLNIQYTEGTGTMSRIETVVACMTRCISLWNTDSCIDATGR